ncbi:ribosomal protein S18-alanine N-acetyltransferase [Accumulibacter sp.]|uniref:ribosomal protein S18-alanine N-acetyltransferase n=1 Tax=Accumulibacter sp. TaxID=2053492 RepID=UPI00342DF140
MLVPRVEMLPLGHHDVDQMVAIEEGVFPYPWTRGNFVDSIDSGYSAWGCRVAGELVGYFVLMIAVDEAHLLNIGVLGTRQRMGFGTRLLQCAMTTARQAGASSLLLEVRPSNENALALYRQFGFRQIGLRRGYYPVAEGREDALVLRRELDRIRA